MVMPNSSNVFKRLWQLRMTNLRVTAFLSSWRSFMASVIWVRSLRISAPSSICSRSLLRPALFEEVGTAALRACNESSFFAMVWPALTRICSFFAIHLVMLPSGTLCLAATFSRGFVTLHAIIASRSLSTVALNSSPHWVLWSLPLAFVLPPFFFCFFRSGVSHFGETCGLRGDNESTGPAFGEIAGFPGDAELAGAAAAAAFWCQIAKNIFIYLYIYTHAPWFQIHLIKF